MQALIDKGGVDKVFAEWALNYKPDRTLPKNYRFKGLGKTITSDYILGGEYNLQQFLFSSPWHKRPKVGCETFRRQKWTFNSCW